MLTFNACSNNEDHLKELTFEDIEKEFGFEKPLSEKSKETIMHSFVNLEEYRSYILNAHHKIMESDKKRSGMSNLKGGRLCDVYLNTPDGQCMIYCADDMYILDAAEEIGIDLPYSCRAGACSTCTGKCIGGDYDDSDQSFLDPDQQDEGFCLLCVTYPCNNSMYVTHQEDEL